MPRVTRSPSSRCVELGARSPASRATSRPDTGSATRASADSTRVRVRPSRSAPGVLRSIPLLSHIRNICFNSETTRCQVRWHIRNPRPARGTGHTHSQLPRGNPSSCRTRTSVASRSSTRIRRRGAACMSPTVTPDAPTALEIANEGNGIRTMPSLIRGRALHNVALIVNLHEVRGQLCIIRDLRIMPTQPRSR